LVKRVLSDSAKTTQPNQHLSSSSTALGAELDGFVSIEELEQMAFVAESEAGPPNSPGRRTGNPEDPRAWANEFEIFDGEETIIDANLYNRLDLGKPRTEPLPTPAGPKVRVHANAASNPDDEDAETQPQEGAGFGATTPTSSPPASDTRGVERASASSRPAGAPVVVRNTTAGPRSTLNSLPTADASVPGEGASVAAGVAIGLAGAALIIGIAWYAFL
jgi:hypothetical protein